MPLRLTRDPHATGPESEVIITLPDGRVVRQRFGYSHAKINIYTEAPPDVRVDRGEVFAERAKEAAVPA